MVTVGFMSVTRVNAGQVPGIKLTVNNQLVSVLALANYYHTNHTYVCILQKCKIIVQLLKIRPI